MKVAFRLSTMGFGGAERVFLSVARILASQYGVTVDFVVDTIGQGETENLVTEGGFQLIGLSCTRTMKSIFPLAQYIDKHQPDVLISAYTDTNMAALISGKLAKHPCKVIVSEHASLNEHWQHASRKRKLLLNFYVTWGYRLADHILAVSQGIAKQISERGLQAVKISCIYNPVRFSLQAMDTTHDEIVLKKNKNHLPVILAVGRITRQKDYITLLQAFNLLIKDKAAQLVIVGGVHEQSEKDRLDAFIEAHQLQDKITFVGFTENVQSFYAKADVFVLSSAWEGFGNVIVEALAFALPIVATNCNHGPSEILADGQFGQLVPVGDFNQMAKSLRIAIETRHEVDIEKLQHRCLDFSEERIASQYYDLIEKITGAK